MGYKIGEQIIYVLFFLGGIPAARSRTATLLRLHLSH
jgi:hypothetical protein